MNWLQPAFQLCHLLPALPNWPACVAPNTSTLLCSCSYSATLWAWTTFSSFLSFSDPRLWGSTPGPSPSLTSSRAAINCFIYLYSKSRFYSNKNIQGQKLGLKFTDCNDYRWAQAVGSVPGTLTTKWEDSLMVPRIKCKKIWATPGKKEMERSQLQWEPWSERELAIEELVREKLLNYIPCSPFFL